MDHPATTADRPRDRFDWLLEEAPRPRRSKAVQALGRPAPDWTLEAARLIGPDLRVLEIAGNAPQLHEAAAPAARSYVCLLAPSAPALPAARGPGAVFVRGRPEDLAAAGRQFDAVACWDRELDDPALVWAERLVAPRGAIMARRTFASEAAWERRGWLAERLIDTAEGTLAVLRRRRDAVANAAALRAA